MSRRTIIVTGAGVLVLAVAGVLLYTQLESKAPGLTDGPGMLYFYSPT